MWAVYYVVVPHAHRANDTLPGIARHTGVAPQFRTFILNRLKGDSYGKGDEKDN